MCICRVRVCIMSLWGMCGATVRVGYSCRLLGDRADWRGEGQLWGDAGTQLGGGAAWVVYAMGC